MNKTKNKPYTSNIIKAAALIPDVKLTLSNWDPSMDIDTNLSRILQKNIFGKASRKRLKKVLAVFRKRFLDEIQVREALRKYVDAHLIDEAFRLILYFHTARSDNLVYDIVIEFVKDMQKRGKIEIDTDDFLRELNVWNEEGKMTTHWGETTINRVARNLATALRDFGLLEGNVNKRIADFRMPQSTFAHVAFFLHSQNPSGSSVLTHADWDLFFLSSQEVEQLFLEAHQYGLLEYYSAGSTVRLEFPSETLEEYADVILQRAS